MRRMLALTIWAACCCWLLGVSAKESTVPVASAAVNWDDSKVEAALVVRRFTNYFLTFPVDPAQEQPVCLAADYHNATAQLLNRVVQACARADFTIRTVSRSQITLKPLKNMTNQEQDGSGSSKGASAKRRRRKKGKMKRKEPSEGNPEADKQRLLNGTEGESAESDYDEAAAGDEEDEEGKEAESRETIHEFLLMALLLPDHPFSDRLRRHVRRVGPMYPQVSIIVGHAFDFRDIASKYLITSFPRVILFKKGIFSGEFGLLDDEGALAAQLSLWTKSWPYCHPLPTPSRSAAVRDATIPSASASQSLASFLTSLVLQCLDFAKPFPPVEPFVGSVPHDRYWELAVYVLSCLYVLLRLGHLVYCSCLSRGH